MYPHMIVVAALSAAVALPAVAAEDFVKPENSGWEVKSCAKLRYPEKARYEEQTDRVVVSFEIGADGRVRDSALARPSRHPLLAEASLEAVKTCVFTRKPGAGAPPVSERRMFQYVWDLTDAVPVATAP